MSLVEWVPGLRHILIRSADGSALSSPMTNRGLQSLFSFLFNSHFMNRNHPEPRMISHDFALNHGYCGTACTMKTTMELPEWGSGISFSRRFHGWTFEQLEQPLTLLLPWKVLGSILILRDVPKFGYLRNLRIPMPISQNPSSNIWLYR